MVISKGRPLFTDGKAKVVSQLSHLKLRPNLTLVRAETCVHGSSFPIHFKLKLHKFKFPNLRPVVPSCLSLARSFLRSNPASWSWPFETVTSAMTNATHSSGAVLRWKLHLQLENHQSFCHLFRGLLSGPSFCLISDLTSFTTNNSNNNYNRSQHYRPGSRVIARQHHSLTIPI